MIKKLTIFLNNLIKNKLITKNFKEINEFNVYIGLQWESS